MKKVLVKMISMALTASMAFSAMAFGAAAADSTPLFSDNFNSYEDAAAALAGGWYKQNDLNSLGTTTIAEATPGDSHGKSLAVSWHDYVGTRHDLENVSSGKYILKASVYVQNEILIRVNTANASGEQDYLLNFGTDSGLRSEDGDGSRYETGYATNTWYDVEMIFDLNRSKWSFTLSGNGTSFASSEYNMVSGTTIKSVTFVTYQQTGTTYVDDVSFAPYVENLVRLYDDFNSYTSANDAKNAGWYKSDDSSTIGTATIEKVSETDTHGNSLKVLFDSWQGIAHSLADMSSSGKYKVRASVYVPSGGSANVKMRSASTECTVIFSTAAGLCVWDTTNNTTIQNVLPYNRDQWYTVQMIIDCKAGSWTLELFNSTGDSVGTAGPYSVAAGQTMNMLQVGVNDNSTIASYFDDISVERYYSAIKPVVTMTDLKGDNVNVSQTVTPGVKTIAIDFGEEMTTSTVVGAVKLDGNAVTGAFDSENCIYTITRTEPLSEGSHTLTIDNTIQDVHGSTMDTSYSMEFTVGKSEPEVEFAGMYDVPMGQSLNYDSAAIDVTWGGSYTSGNYILKASVKVGQDMGIWGGNQNILNFGGDRNIYLSGASMNTAYTSNEWYNFEIAFDYTAKTYTVNIKDLNGNAIITDKSGSLTNQFGSTGITFANGGAVTSYIDNIWFGPAGGTAVLDEDFESYTSISQLNSSIWQQRSGGNWKFETIMNENSRVNGLSDIKANSHLAVKAKYMNPGDESPSVFIVAYYKENKFVAADFISSNDCLKSFTGGEFVRQTKIPSVEFDEVDVYCWNSMSSMRPFCVPIELK